MNTFDEMLAASYEQLKSVIYRVLKDWHLSEDIAQEAAIKAFTRFEQFEVGRKFGPWICRIGRNAAIDWLKHHHTKRRRNEPTMTESVHAGLATECPQSRNETSEEVRFILERVQQRHRETLVAVHLAGETAREIAKHRSMPESTVRWNLMEARKEFRRDYESHVGKQYQRAAKLRDALRKIGA